MPLFSHSNRPRRALVSSSSHDARLARAVLETLEGRRLLSQTPYLGSPFTIGATPVTIQGEDFDLGGQGFAYSDTDVQNDGGH